VLPGTKWRLSEGDEIAFGHHADERKPEFSYVFRTGSS